MAQYFNVNQLKLVSAISAEIAAQCPGIHVDSEQFNTIIAAANMVKDAYQTQSTETKTGGKQRMTPDFVSPPAPSLGKRNKCCCRGRK
ncbi:hypothetical protein [Rosenbergiella collisarenosi]|uniref:hypothetical protein n=1 Tax=Rosenbergiella collisarenosi TaxID=1544695 RepID=UPI001F4DED16|nr:hypothetical protein [Rosenbergiella collisarenosi]